MRHPDLTVNFSCASQRDGMLVPMAKFPARPGLLLALSSLLVTGAFSAVAEPASRTLFLIRHGIFDVQVGVDEKTGNALTALGREQAVDVAGRLASLQLEFDTITSSEFTRARETGDIIAAKLGLPCARDGLLNECSPTRFDQPPKPQQATSDAQLAQAWARYTAPANGAPVHQLLVCHGNVIRWFVCRALGADTKQWINMEIANCSITIIQIRADGSIRLQMFNDVSHVPLDQQTWAGRGPGWPLPAQAKPKAK
jgi:serine/threonine-protein phosphatase PGAM5